MLVAAVGLLRFGVLPLVRDLVVVLRPLLRQLDLAEREPGLGLPLRRGRRPLLAASGQGPKARNRWPRLPLGSACPASGWRGITCLDLRRGHRARGGSGRWHRFHSGVPVARSLATLPARRRRVARHGLRRRPLPLAPGLDSVGDTRTLCRRSCGWLRGARRAGAWSNPSSAHSGGRRRRWRRKSAGSRSASTRQVHHCR
mmetsp:Transcript_19310/g.60599  ORF Transcript_19310/g.60599 Transcript_19310/m.60599 type:complete len:200 (-) Transcript_19310:28-627(-)